MKTIPLTHGKFAIVDDEDFEMLNQHKWCLLGEGGYARRAINIGKNRTSTMLMHRLIMGSVKGEEVDHINMDKLDNRRANLRKATSQQNRCNRPKPRNNKSGYKGVRWHKGAWEAYIGLNGKFIHLGRFGGINDAALAYQAAAKKLHGEFARWNP